MFVSWLRIVFWERILISEMSVWRFSVLSVMVLYFPYIQNKNTESYEQNVTWP